MSFVREAPQHALRFTWSGEEPYARVATFAGGDVGQIDVWSWPHGRPSIGRSKASFAAVCDVWLQRQGLSGVTSEPVAAPASSKVDHPVASGRTETSVVQWEQFATLVRTDPAHYVQEEDAWHIVLADPLPPHRRQSIFHQNIGGMDFIEVISPLGNVRNLDLFGAFKSVRRKLCGLTQISDEELALRLVVPLRGFDLSDWRWPLAAMNVYVEEVARDAGI